MVILAAILFCPKQFRSNRQIWWRLSVTVECANANSSTSTTYKGEREREIKLKKTSYKKQFLADDLFDSNTFLRTNWYYACSCNIVYTALPPHIWLSINVQLIKSIKTGSHYLPQFIDLLCLFDRKIKIKIKMKTARKNRAHTQPTNKHSLNEFFSLARSKFKMP